MKRGNLRRICRGSRHHSLSHCQISSKAGLDRLAAWLALDPPLTRLEYVPGLPTPLSCMAALLLNVIVGHVSHNARLSVVRRLSHVISRLLALVRLSDVVA